MRDLIFVAGGGAIGAVTRYCIGQWVHTKLGNGFPYGTFCVNMLGCFLIGILAHLSQTSNWISSDLRLALGVGFLGALTTFSTFGYETVFRIQNDDWSLAIVNVLVNVLIGLLAVWLGMLLARTFGGATA